MKPIITKFNDKTGDVKITIPVPFTVKDGIEYANMRIADIPKYEDTKDYNVFDLIRENQELKKQLSNSRQIKNQQKEFIEWLERRLFLLRDEASELALGMCSTNYQDTKIEVYKEVLSKYKEIIGGLDE